jgi:isopenicillin-N epimerase
VPAPQPDADADWSPWRAAWDFAPGVCYLNHGSFGPPPRAVLQARSEWLARLVGNPMEFYVRRLGEYLWSAQEVLGRLVGTSADNLVLVDNSTTAMNLVAESFPLAAGDEVLITDHDYGAVLRIWERACGRAGARLVVQRVPLPVESAGAVVDAVLAGITSRTRLLVFSHVTSPTALIFPAAELCRAAHERDLAVCVDGPHALAQLDVSLDALDCDYYTASCHKWLSAPFGSGFLYVHPRRQAQVRPSVVSWGRPLEGHPPGWRDELNWVGTRDSSSYLAVPAAIEFLHSVGLEAFRARTHGLAQRARRRIEEITGLPGISPDSAEWYGSMVALPLPRPAEAAPELQRALWQRWGIEAPCTQFDGRCLLRVSCHLYNQAADLDQLAEAVRELLG